MSYSPLKSIIATLGRLTASQEDVSSNLVSGKGFSNFFSSSTSAAPASISGLSRLLGINRDFHSRLLTLFNLGYKCRLQLPICISVGFFLCHLFSNYVPRVEINVQVVEEELQVDIEDDDSTEPEEEYEDDDMYEDIDELESDEDDGEQNEVRNRGVEYEIVGEFRLQ